MKIFDVLMDSEQKICWAGTSSHGNASRVDACLYRYRHDAVNPYSWEVCGETECKIIDGSRGRRTTGPQGEHDSQTHLAAANCVRQTGSSCRANSRRRIRTHL